MSSMKPVKFYCEFCGEEVRANDRICPHCGSFFSQVRCQACGFSGDSRLFLRGCPQCGFQSGPSGKAAGKAGDLSRSLDGGLERIPYGVDELLGQRPGAGKAGSGPPAWVWGLALGLFAAFMVASWLVVKGC